MDPIVLEGAGSSWGKLVQNDASPGIRFPDGLCGGNAYHVTHSGQDKLEPSSSVVWP